MQILGKTGGNFVKLSYGSETLDKTSEGMVEMFEGDFADTCAIVASSNFLLVAALLSTYFLILTSTCTAVLHQFQTSCSLETKKLKQEQNLDTLLLSVELLIFIISVLHVVIAAKVAFSGFPRLHLSRISAEQLDRKAKFELNSPLEASFLHPSSVVRLPP